MNKESIKKETNRIGKKKTTNPVSAKVHLLPLRSRHEPENPEFARLAHKLDDRMSKIELQLKDNFEILESDLQKALKSNRLENNQKDVQKDLETLSKHLETRFQKTLDHLTTKEKPSKKKNERLEAIKKLSSQLMRTLSMDFYKNVISQLGHVEYDEEVDPFGMDRRLVEQIKPLFDFFYFKYWRVTTTGIENIPNEGRALIVGNHSGALPYDGAMIKMAILNEHPKRKDARFLVEDFVYHMPIMGTFVYRIGGVRACPENATRLLKSDHLVVVFPEGVKGIGKYFKQRYKLQRFGRGGFIKLCMRTKSPLIPVGIVGAEEIHPIIFKSNILAKTIGVPYIPITPTFPLLGLLGCIPLPTKWSIHFGKPIQFDKYSASAQNDDLLIHKLSEKVRDEIQSIIVELLRKRRSIWLG